MAFDQRSPGTCLLTIALPGAPAKGTKAAVERARRYRAQVTLTIQIHEIEKGP